MKKMCEICGQMKPQEDFSKSYKNRCKACVAEMARDNRHASKKPSAADIFSKGIADVLCGGMEAPYGKPKTYARHENRLYAACFAMQGILSSGYIPEAGSSIAKEAVHLGDMLLSELDNTSQDHD